MHAAAAEYMEPGEELRVCADMMAGSYRLMAMAPFFGKPWLWPRHYVIATDRRLLLIKATPWRGRPTELVSSDDLSGLVLEQYKKMKVMVRIRRPNGEVFYCWGNGGSILTTGRWRQEVEQLAQLLPSGSGVAA
jgi:hypothetical protein